MASEFGIFVSRQTKQVLFIYMVIITIDMVNYTCPFLIGYKLLMLLFIIKLYTFTIQ